MPEFSECSGLPDFEYYTKKFAGHKHVVVIFGVTHENGVQADMLKHLQPRFYREWLIDTKITPQVEVLGSGTIGLTFADDVEAQLFRMAFKR